jgi:hypothetical protein
MISLVPAKIRVTRASVHARGDTVFLHEEPGGTGRLPRLTPDRLLRPVALGVGSELASDEGARRRPELVVLVLEYVSPHDPPFVVWSKLSVARSA